MRAALFISAALIAAPAYAQNQQIELRGVSAVTSVEVGEAQDVGASAIAGGNAVTAVNIGVDAVRTNSQTMAGATQARAEAEVWDAPGVVTISAAAVNNGATAQAQGGDLEIRSTQSNSGDAGATANLQSGYAGYGTASASASGNVGAVSAENSEIRAISTQTSSGAVSASSEADYDAADVGAGAAIASANNVTVAGDTATVLTDTTQRASGAGVDARSDVYVGYANDAASNATANANAITIDNQWGYVNARADQQSSANVQADSYVTLGGDFTGYASAGAYGVGNSFNVSNVGSDTDLDVTQANSGDVSANAAMIGQGGDIAVASAAAYGNSMSAALCAYCDTNMPEMHGAGSQVNDGAVNASARVVAPSARVVGASATAIGNAATFQTTGPTN
ncbi:MAG TPA: holdfast anchor protein HfaD [Terricaulis sp.]|nr:holdfast anchor protein HfaD [Terricaulis sp.]